MRNGIGSYMHHFHYGKCLLRQEMGRILIAVRRSQNQGVKGRSVTVYPNTDGTTAGIEGILTTTRPRDTHFISLVQCRAQFAKGAKTNGDRCELGEVGRRMGTVRELRDNAARALH
jgi:hypothetical protein